MMKSEKLTVEYPEWLNVIQLDECDSTNTYIKNHYGEWCKENTKKNPEEKIFPILVTSHLQTTGRGREQRPWLSTKGKGLYSSFGFEWRLAWAPQLLPIVAGLSIIDSLQQVANVEPGLKWPNDILYDHKKIAGILIENLIYESQLFCITGIGINLNHLPGDFPPELTGKAISLKMITMNRDKSLTLYPDYPIDNINRVLTRSLFSWLEKLKQGKIQEIVNHARHASQFLLNRPITFHQPSNNQFIYGIFKGINIDGALLLGTPGGETSLHYSGEIIPGICNSR